jgi:hypothetical protein
VARSERARRAHVHGLSPTRADGWCLLLAAASDIHTHLIPVSMLMPNRVGWPAEIMTVWGRTLRQSMPRRCSSTLCVPVIGRHGTSIGRQVENAWPPRQSGHRTRPGLERSSRQVTGLVLARRLARPVTARRCWRGLPGNSSPRWGRSRSGTNGNRDRDTAEAAIHTALVYWPSRGHVHKI